MPPSACSQQTKDNKKSRTKLKCYERARALTHTHTNTVYVIALIFINTNLWRTCKHEQRVMDIHVFVRSPYFLKLESGSKKETESVLFSDRRFFLLLYRSLNG